MRRLLKTSLKSIALLLALVVVFYAGVSMAVFRGYGTTFWGVPGSCWGSNFLVVNDTGQDIDSLVMRQGEEIFWQGTVFDGDGGCVPKLNLSTMPMTITATLADGAVLMENISRPMPFDPISWHGVYVLHVKSLEIDLSGYRGVQGAPVGDHSWGIDLFGLFMQDFYTSLFIPHRRQNTSGES